MGLREPGKHWAALHCGAEEGVVREDSLEEGSIPILGHHRLPALPGQLSLHGHFLLPWPQGHLVCASHHHPQHPSRRARPPAACVPNPSVAQGCITGAELLALEGDGAPGPLRPSQTCVPASGWCPPQGADSHPSSPRAVGPLWSPLSLSCVRLWRPCSCRPGRLSPALEAFSGQEWRRAESTQVSGFFCTAEPRVGSEFSLRMVCRAVWLLSQ